MRIGIFSDAYLPVINGVVTSIETLRKGLIRLGHEVFIISNHSKIYDIQYENNVLLLPGIKISFLFDNNLSNPLQSRASELIKQMNLDVIHVQTEFGIGLFARIIAKRLEIPLIYTYHTTWEDYTHYINPYHFKPVEKIARKAVAVLSKQLSKPANAIITPSSKTKTLLEEYGVYQPIHVIPTGVDLSRFEESEEIKSKVSEIKARYQISDDDTVLVFVGRLGEEKDLETVIEAISQIDNPHLKFLIIGDGPIFDNLNKMIQLLKLEKQIFLVGRIPNDQIAAYYHAGDAFISASMTETQGLTFIEAMACGLPLFASDREVLLDLLFEEENGYFFHSQLQCIEKLSKFLSLSSQEKKVMAHKSLELVKPYSATVFVESVVNLYERVMRLKDSDYTVTKVDNNRVEFSNELNYVSMFLPLEVINSNNIQEDRIVNIKEMSELKEKDLIQKKLSKALTRLTYHDYSIKQMSDYLATIEPINEELDQGVIRELLDKNFLDDERFINELIERYQEKGYGVYRIEKNLEKYQFDDHLVELMIDYVSKQQNELMHQQFHKTSQMNHKGSLISVKNKIIQKLIRQGFEASIVTQLVTNSEINYDELESCRLEYEKIKSKDVNIKQKLYQKGFLTETINKVIGEEYE